MPTPSEATPGGAWDRHDVAAASGLALAVLLRWGDRARSLLSWDANTFAIALEDYDIRALHPHAPGYPVYVAAGRVVHAIVADANDALVALSLLFFTAALFGLYGLARAVGGRPVALAACVLLLVAPVAYVHSVTANAYTAEMAGSVLVAWAAWRAHHAPTRTRLAVLAVALALAVGVRPSLAIYLVPVAAWAALRPPWDLAAQARRLGPALALGALTALAWFVPMLVLTGGYGPWAEANRLQTSQVVFAHTLFNAGWPAVADNLERLALYLQWELRWILPVVLALAAVALVGRRGLRPSWSGPAGFLAVWLLPALLFFATVYTGFNEGPSGYILAVLPGLLLAACLVGAAAVRRAWAWDARVAATVAVGCLLVPACALAGHREDVQDVHYKEHDAWAAAWGHLPGTFPPANTSIVALWNFAFVWANFPDYTTYDYRPPGNGPGEIPDFLLIQEARDHRATPKWYDAIAERRTAGPHPLAPGTEVLVLFDFQLAGENGGPRQVRADVPVLEGRLDNGWRVLYVQVTPDRPLLEDYFTLEGHASGA